MRFVDKVRINAKAGQGGKGCLSFLREKYREFGGPDGGDGGRGGNIVLRADPGMGTLLDFSHRPHLFAENGDKGKSSNKAGRDAPDMLVRVPVGTVVYKEGRLLADLSKTGAEVLVAKGGRGGRGNASFKSHSNTAPRIYEKGAPGEEATLDLELKLIADVGLVGFPNAGKSTFLSRVSNARPKIADYPFTTLAPHLGLTRHKGVDFLVADIPGLIEGAHEGKGLGIEFLRHVERTRLLIHLIDPLGYGSVSAVDGVRKIEEELRGHSRTLAAKTRILVVNKMDLPEGQKVLECARKRYVKRRVFGISGFTGEGLDVLLDHMVRQLSSASKIASTATPQDEQTVRLKAGFSVSKNVTGEFLVSGPYVERAAAMADISLIESVWRLQRTLRRIGVDKALRLAGVKEGDTVRIGKLEMEWSPPQD